MSNVVVLQSGGKIAGIVPQTIEDVFRLAKAISLSGLAPSSMGTPEKLTVAIMHGLEIGLPPMQAIQRIAVVNGRPTIWGDAIPALVLAKGFKLVEKIVGEGEIRTAVCKVIRPDGTEYERMFSVCDAKTAGLWGKQGPWKQYPDRMLQMRARGFACRDGAADVLAGLYLREEIEEEPKDITPKVEKQTVLPPLPSEKKALPPMIGEAQDAEESSETEEARQAIADSVNVAMLDHLRETYPNADWKALESGETKRRAELEKGNA